MTTRDGDPTEQLLDLFVYAPLGLLLEARDLLPQLAQKGRGRLGGQVTVARMVGELAVRQGQRRAEQAIERLRQQNRAGAGPAPLAPTAPPRGRARPAAATSAPAPASASAPTGSSALAIPGYDTLSASQVVPRLAGLSVEELEAVRAYEAATRARKTVLTRIEQLRGSA